MLEKIADRELLFRLADDLKRTRFKPGYDNMDANALKLWLTVNYDKLYELIRRGRYKPRPAIGFHITKQNGDFRKLARITALDTVVQRAILAVFGAECDKQFSDSSHAYRTGRGTSSALEQYCNYASCMPFVSKLDPSNCFDSIDHSVLRSALSSFTDSKLLIDILMNFAAQDIIIDNEIIKRDSGILQGAPISSLLCNVYFHRLDIYLQERQIPFVRYADDVAIFGDDIETLTAITDDVRAFYGNELKLELNPDKTKISVIAESEFLSQHFEVERSGIINIKSASASPAVHYGWNTGSIENRRRSVDILSDGILRQKDLTIALETDTSLSTIPVSTVSNINVFSNVTFDGGLLSKLFAHGISVNVFDNMCNLIGCFTPERAISDPRLTIEQLKTYDNPKLRLSMAKKFVRAAIHNIRLVIRYYNKNYPSSIYDETLKKINSEDAKIKKCLDYNELLLSEARVHRLYYDCFDIFVLGSGFVFDTRTKRPPENEINAMISFGNTVLYNLIATEISKTELDVRIGYLHATNRRLRSLNLDVAESFKPLIIDRTIFKLVNKGIIRSEHFDHLGERAVVLNRQGKRIFLDHFYQKLDSKQSINGESMSYLDLIRLEVRKLIRHFRAGEEFVPFKQVR